MGWKDLREGDLLLPYININFGAGISASNYPPSIRRSSRLWLLTTRTGPYPRVAGRSADPDLLLETMPYAEPRSYVRAVYENYAYYRQLYQAKH